MSDNGRESLQSVRRALRTLDLIAEAGDMGVTELSRRLGVHKATASRLAHDSRPSAAGSFQSIFVSLPVSPL